jgi:DNA-binding beta-propeller fold protein YncE
VTTLPVAGLYQPTGIAVSANGTIYVSNYGDSTTASSHPGEIVDIAGSAERGAGRAAGREQP